jgi:hypothetical protein
MHETLEDHTEVRLGSERSFGVVFAVVFVIVGLLPLLGSGGPRYWSLGVAGIFLVIAFFIPKILAPLNRLWYRVGLVLHSIVNPIIMGLMFYGVITPTGLVMRLLGKDILRLKFDPRAESYWIDRESTDSVGKNLKNQF